MPRTWITPMLVSALGLAAASGNVAGRAGDIAVAARAFHPGEIVLVTATFEEPLPTRVSVHAFGRTTPAYPDSANTWRAIAAIDLDDPPGRALIVAEAHIAGTTLKRTATVTVLPKRFRTRRLRVAPGFVDPPTELAERLAREAAFLREVYGASANERLWHEPFVRPVPDAATSSFGTRSVFNGKPRSPHAGTDFASPAGTPVRAPNAGRVVAARELFFSGGTVIVDHGLGLFSMLGHLSTIDVQEGDMVDAGDLVGGVGATGRVTGPHLHWALRASGARVDPLAAIELLGRAR